MPIDPKLTGGEKVNLLVGPDSSSSTALWAQRIMEAQRRHEDILGNQVQRMMEAQLRREDILGNHVQRIMEAQRRHEDILGNQVQRMMDQYRRQQDLVSIQVQRMMEACRRQQDTLGRQALGASGYLTVPKSLDSIAFLTRQARDWSRLVDTTALGLASRSNLNPDIFLNAQGAWADGITGLLGATPDLDLSAQIAALGGRITSLSSAYSSFCERALRDLDRTIDTHTRDALIGSVTLAKQHFAGAAISIPPLFVYPPDGAPPRPLKPIRLYVVQQDELSASPDIRDPQNVTELTEMSPAAGAASRVLEMLRLIPQVNAAAKLSGRAEILKPTSRMIEAALDLVGLVPTNKMAFADFIDCLYWLFYEAAGKDNLRYLAANGGPHADKDCELIWAIKTFRNKWYRHDPDHGDASAIRRSYRSLKETLQHFGFEQLPVNASDYRRLHLLLVNELVQFLQKLRDAL